jgi:hypothetical protein
MAHFAKLSESNEVLAVLTINNSDIVNTNGQESEEKGIEFLTSVHGWTNWKQTSYNTREGKHYQQDNNTLSEDQSKAFRGNFAAIGMIYDTENNVFREPTTQYTGWVLNTTKGVYEPPIERPSENHYWDNNTQSWVVI